MPASQSTASGTMGGVQHNCPVGHSRKVTAMLLACRRILDQIGLHCALLAILAGALSLPVEIAAQELEAETDQSLIADESGESARLRRLFNGESLDGWSVLDQFSFKRHGEVRVEDERIVLAAGNPATGIVWQGEPPRGDYELRLEAMRVEGHDFFCGLTFPVGESHCTLILGGWGGTVVGLSNVDDMSAVENQTTDVVNFENGRWYAIRLRVTADAISAWVDDRQIVDLATKDRKFNVWWEQEPARPLGITSWYTTAAIRDIELALLDEQPVDAALDAASDANAGAGAEAPWQSLFDGQKLGGWKQSEFGGAADVTVEDSRIVIGFCDGCNGVTWTDDFPKTDYELRLEAMRVDGNDFFCGLTFPVGDDPCSLIVGGWGGAVVGLSSIDGRDAARNETTKRIGFERGRWYAIRLRVAGGRIQAWIDEQPVVDLATAGRKISIRSEVTASKPLGIASWCTTAALRNIEWRAVDPAAVESDDTNAADLPVREDLTAAGR